MPAEDRTENRVVGAPRDGAAAGVTLNLARHATPSVRPDRPRLRLGLWLPFGVVLAGAAVSGVLWSQAREAARQELHAYFDFRVRDARMRLQQRLETYEQVMLGARSLFSASASVNRAEFAAYVDGLHLEERRPGIQGLGYASRLTEGQRLRHEAAIRREGFADYRVRPEGRREPLTAIIYLEPFKGRNLRAFGYDMYSEPVRREAMERAWREDATALSAAVRLVQETDQDVQSGFLMYLPVYRNGVSHRTSEERRQALAGWVYAPFRMNDFMAGILGEREMDLDIEIRDGEGPGELPLMYDRAPGYSGTGPRQTFESVETVAFGGHRWTLTVRALPGLESRLRQDGSIHVLIVGGLGTLVVALAAWALALSRDRALALAGARRLEVEAERLHHEEAMGVLAKGLAHDFNNLLQAILSWVEIARLRIEPGSPAGTALAHMDEASGRARDLSERLRLLGDESHPLDTVGPLDELLRGAVGEALAGADVAVEYDLAPGAVVRFDSGQLHRVFLNLAANAREAMKGRGRIRVASRIETLAEGEGLPLESGRYLHFSLADEGPGIPPDLLPWIFEPYVSTKQAFSQKGLGLGLALCRIIARRHRGALMAESRAEGATFHLYLPIVPPEPEAGQA